MTDLREIWMYVKKYFSYYKKRIVIYILISSFCAGIEAIIPYISGTFLDYLLTSASVRYIFTYCMIFILLNICNILLLYIEKMQEASLKIDMSTLFKMNILRHVQKISLSFTNSKEKSSYAYGINKDVDELVSFIINFLQRTVKNTLYLIIPFLYLMRTDLVLFAVSLLMLPVIYICIKFYSKKIFLVQVERRKYKTLFFEKIKEQLFDIKFIKINQVDMILRQKYNTIVDEKRKIDVANEQITFAYTVVSRNIDIILIVFLFIYGGIGVVNGRMTIGEFVILYKFLSMIISGFTYFISLNQEVQTNKAFYMRLKEITDILPEIYGKSKIDGIEEIKISNLVFGYGSKEIIEGFDYEFKKGHIYSIIGENGAGKSTIIGLLLGLYIDEFKGEIRYNNHQIKELDIPWVRRELMGVSEQEPSLLSDTIGFNITYAEKKERDEHRLHEVITAVSLNDYIEQSRDGIESVIRPDAANLSGGQKQKISIAKALYKNPDVLILDEPTSALDKKSKENFLSYLSKIKENKIIILITHDKSFLEITDKVIQV